MIKPIGPTLTRTILIEALEEFETGKGIAKFLSADVVSSSINQARLGIAALDFRDWAKEYLKQYEGIDSWALGQLREIVSRFEEVQ